MLTSISGLFGIVAALIALAPVTTMAIAGWNLAGNDARSFVMETDRDVYRSGESSGLLASIPGTTPTGFGAMVQPFRADDYRGKRVRYTAWLKTQDVTGTGAGLWLRIDSDERMLAIDNMMTRSLKGTTEWTRVSIVLDVPTEAVGMLVGSLLVGTGSVWIDEALFEVVGTDVPVTAKATSVAAPLGAGQAQSFYGRARSAPANLGFEPPR